MKFTVSLFCLIALLLGMALPAAQAQQTDALRKEFLEYKAKAEKGDAKAQSNLGVCYMKGEGVEKDFKEAAKWFRKAADQDFALAQSNLATCYETGQGVGKDFVEAYAWYNLASTTIEEASNNREALEKAMSPKEVAAAQKRATKLRAQIEAKLKAGGR